MGKSLVKPAITVMRRYNELIIKEDGIFSFFFLLPLLIMTFPLLPLKLQRIGISRTHQEESAVKLLVERTSRKKSHVSLSGR